LRTVPDPAAERQPVRARKHQVENDETRPLPLQKLACGVPIARLDCRVALTSEVLNDDVSDRRLVVDDQNGLHTRILHASPYKTVKSTLVPKRDLRSL
jgi:hypothetical protein